MKSYFKYIIVLLVLLSCESSSGLLSMVQQSDLSILEDEYLGWWVYPIHERPGYLSVSYHSGGLDLEENTVWYNMKNQQFSLGDNVFIDKASFLLKDLKDMTESWNCKFISFVSERTENHYFFSLVFSNKHENYRIIKTDLYENFKRDFDKPLPNGWYLQSILY